MRHYLCDGLEKKEVTCNEEIQHTLQGTQDNRS